MICVPEVPASQMVLTIITDEQLEAFADAVITKYQQTIVRRKAAEKPLEECCVIVCPLMRQRWPSLPV